MFRPHRGAWDEDFTHVSDRNLGNQVRDASGSSHEQAWRARDAASPSARRIAAFQWRHEPYLQRSGRAMKNPNLRAWRGLIVLAIVMSLSLFVSAGTMHYWQAWGYLAVYFGASLLITRYLIKRDPALLQRRWSGGPNAEQEKTQRIIMRFVLTGLIALLVVPALDYRFGWSGVPPYAVVTGDILVAVGFLITFCVYRENTFTSATIEVAKDQKVISTGPYAVVRHPMYAGVLLYLFGTPLALGSYWGFLALAAIAPFYIWRLFDEERFLSKNLPGYTEYCAEARWRLIPRVF